MFKRSKFLLVLLVWVTACQQEPGETLVSSPTVQAVQATDTTPAEIETPQSPVPTMTLAVPTATAQGVVPEIRLEEDFESADTCLETFEQVEASAFVFEGQLILDAISPETNAISTCQSLVAGNFVLEADMSVLEAPQDAPYYYGLTFRVSGNESYNFVFGSVGGYCAFYANPDGLLHFTNSTDFVTGCWALPPVDVINAEANQLRVVALDDRMDFFINDELMAVVRDNRLTEGFVGFVVTSGVEGGVRVAFDNLRVLRP